MSEFCGRFPAQYTALSSETASDALGNQRVFSCSEDRSSGGSSTKLMLCSDFRVCTHDYEQVSDRSRWLPKELIRNPPSPWDEVGVSAHANTLEVVKFLKEELEHDGLDDDGMIYCSFVHYSDENAFWLPRHKIFVYGQCEQSDSGSREKISYAAGISIVAHEIFHGVTHFTSRLEGRGEPGALNESYSDIFGVLLANRGNYSIDDWEWEIGVPGGVNSNGFPIRNLSNPSLSMQPDHMQNYRVTNDDQGGVHINNGIHNKAAYNLLISRDSKGEYLFDANSAGFLFYSALRKLSPRSTFLQSRITLTIEANNCFQNENERQTVISAINTAFDNVGIQ